MGRSIGDCDYSAIPSTIKNCRARSGTQDIQALAECEILCIDRCGNPDRIPDTANEIACLIVLQGAVGDVQLLLLLPLTPFTYHVVLATAVGAKEKNSPTNKKQVSSLFLMIVSFHGSVVARCRLCVLVISRFSSGGKW